MKIIFQLTKNTFTLKSSKSKCLTGKLSVPADKSISIRALLISSICFGNTKILNLLESEDVRVKIPTKNINRFIQIPKEIIENNNHKNTFFITVEDLIGNNINTLFNGMECINKTAGFVDGDESKYLEMVTQYLDSENINYEEFNFEKESKVKKDAILQIDF